MFLQSLYIYIHVYTHAYWWKIEGTAGMVSSYCKTAICRLWSHLFHQKRPHRPPKPPRYHGLQLSICEDGRYFLLNLPGIFPKSDILKISTSCIFVLGAKNRLELGESRRDNPLREKLLWWNHEKFQGFGHLKTRWFTIKTAPKCRFGGPQNVYYFTNPSNSSYCKGSPFGDLPFLKEIKKRTKPSIHNLPNPILVHDQDATSNVFACESMWHNSPNMSCWHGDCSHPGKTQPKKRTRGTKTDRIPF